MNAKGTKLLFHAIRITIFFNYQAFAAQFF